MAAIDKHDFKAFCKIRDKYQPNEKGWVYFPDRASVWDGYDFLGYIDVTTPEGFSEITYNEYECG